MSLLIRGATLVDPSQNINERKNVFVKGKAVEAILTDAECDAVKADEVLELDETVVVAPGLIDVHVHLRDPGQTDREDIESGCRAAVAGGFTSLLAMPNTYPVNDNVETTRYMIEKAEQAKLCKVYPVGAITRTSMGEELSPIKDLVEAGCVAVSDDGRPCKDTAILRQAMELARELGVPLIEHCEDLSVSKGASTIADGPLAKKMGLTGLSHMVESSDVARCLILAAETGAKVHLAHISCKESMDMIREYKTKLSNVSTEVCPHHLLLRNEDIERLGTMGKMFPPLRFAEDIKALREALGDETIQVVGTDHAPHLALEKAKEFASAPNGIIGLQSALPLMMNLVSEGVLSLFHLVKAMSTEPAQIFNLKGQGSLKPGTSADICVFSTQTEATISKDENESKSSNSPFWGTAVKSQVLATLVDGEFKYRREM